MDDGAHHLATSDTSADLSSDPEDQDEEGGNALYESRASLGEPSGLKRRAPDTGFARPSSIDARASKKKRSALVTRTKVVHFYVINLGGSQPTPEYHSSVWPE